MASDKPATMDVAPKDRPFRFFDLPRELRDMIYELALVPKQSVKTLSSDVREPHIYVKGGPQKSALSVSKAFKHEYEETLYKKASVLCMDHRDFAFVLPDFPSSLLKMRSVECMLFTLCECKVDSPDYCLERGIHQSNREWLTHAFRAFTVSSSLDVKIGMSSIDDYDQDGYPIACTPCDEDIKEHDFSKFCEINQLSRLRVYYLKHNTYDIAEEGFVDDSLVWTWTKTEGWKHVKRPSDSEDA